MTLLTYTCSNNRRSAGWRLGRVQGPSQCVLCSVEIKRTHLCSVELILCVLCVWAVLVLYCNELLLSRPSPAMSASLSSSPLSPDSSSLWPPSITCCTASVAPSDVRLCRPSTFIVTIVPKILRQFFLKAYYQKSQKGKAVAGNSRHESRTCLVVFQEMTNVCFVRFYSAVSCKTHVQYDLTVLFLLN